MSNWTVDEALKWADTWGPTDGELPTGDQLAIAALSRAVRSAGAELASMRQQFEAADRERSELRADAERYRWLRDPKNAYHDAWNYFSPSGSAAEMDAAIDAAILGARETLRTAALEKDGQPMKKLSQLERGQKFRLHVPGGNPHPLLLTLNTLDGMYSHCTDDDGRVFHLSVWTEVVVDDAA